MSDWTDAAITKLQQLANEGYSASQIGALINRELGTDFSHNAIIGKLHRMGCGVKGNRKTTVTWTMRMFSALEVALAEGLTVQACVRHVSAAAGFDVDPQHVHAKIEDMRKREERAKTQAAQAEARRAVSRLFKAPITDVTPSRPKAIVEVVPVVPCNDAVPMTAGPVSLMDLKDWHCRWDAGRGDDGQMLYCGARKSRGAYCGHHARMVYQPPPERKAKRELPVYRLEPAQRRFA